MNWLWAYFRRRVAEAILAGIHDALTAENGLPRPSEEEAANALKKLPEFGHGGVVVQQKDDTNMAAPPQLPAPREATQNEQPEAPRRGPGRPRKFQEPPE